MSEHGQGRSYLRAGVAIPFTGREGYAPFVDVPVDLVAIAARAAAVLRSVASLAEVEDEVQEEVIRAWMSGRGLPVSSADAARHIVYRVVRRVLSDNAGGRRGRLARWRKQLRNFNAHPSTASSLESNGFELNLLGMPTSFGSPAHAEAAIDARVVIDSALSGGTRQQWAVGRSGFTARARNAAALAILADLLSSDDVATEMGVTTAAVGATRRGLTATLRERFA